MQNYNVGDKVCLFGSSGPHGGPHGERLTSLPGFSRGAYTARALAGMLYKVWNIRILHQTPYTNLIYQVGLLSKDNLEQIPFAYKLYKSTSSSDKTLAQGFKETFCRPVPIDFVGVWWDDIYSMIWSTRKLR